MAEQTSYEDFRAAVEAASLSPLWEVFDGAPPTEPEPLAPHIWPWETLGPLIKQAAHAVPMEDVARRALTLKNPNIGVPGATTCNLVGSLQTLLPGEIARPHRHSGNALRFVLEGNGAETIVDGKPCAMFERDLILTPLLSWHGHVHGGDEHIVWFDALDIPLFKHMNATFQEGGAPPNLPPQIPDSAFSIGGLMPQDSDKRSRYSPIFRYPWEGVQQVLDVMPEATDGSRTLRYTNPVTGGSAMSITDCYVVALKTRAETAPYRTTSDAICVVAEGEGSSHVGAHEIKWSQNDIFTLPGWNWISHKAASDDTRLLMVTDRDAMEKLGMLCEETRA